MTRLAVVLAFVLALVVAAPAGAHPLGNFSVNRLDVVRVSADRVDVRHVLDQAEIPTFQQRDRTRAQRLAAARAAFTRGVDLRVDGRPVPLRLAGPGRLSFRPGAGGLKTMRVELTASTAVKATSTAIELRDDTYAGRVGWRAIVVRPGEGTAVRSSVPSADPTNGLRTYPRDLLSSPPDTRAATLRVAAGDGTVVAPRADGTGQETTSERGGSTEGFAGLLEDAAAGRSVLILLLLAAMGWGALHALSPGHGKAMVAAYLVGTRGTARHAVGLGLTVTVTHTIGVFALGLITLSLSAYVLPEDLLPYLTLASGLLVVAVGASVLRGRVRSARHEHAHAHGHHHHHHGHGHSHGHSHDIPDQITPRGIVAMGTAAGIIPCPSALVVLLAAIAQGEIALGLLLIVAFSAGLALTLTILGLLVVSAGRVLAKAPTGGRGAQVVAALPAVSAVVIMGAGALLSLQALPQL
ncbi:MAG: sulfite exporter TauE/SafE family protein [Solirubrobacteraceae bacterium]|nr:sulfite exporter TauE/SafE family protein [Solirubrobacteraceae bacterium]